MRVYIFLIVAFFIGLQFDARAQAVCPEGYCKKCVAKGGGTKSEPPEAIVRQMSQIGATYPDLSFYKPIPPKSSQSLDILSRPAFTPGNLGSNSTPNDGVDLKRLMSKPSAQHSLPSITSAMSGAERNSAPRPKVGGWLEDGFSAQSHSFAEWNFVGMSDDVMSCERVACVKCGKG